ncbi:chitin synthase export chaperone [Protomyces lactucae-debilis]|uniref:Chitin synthase export chaperone n=1 Tax=Protomyces lactucae-debilis TaxID=2754530 RepID=A0A1Y2EYA4_PROLT|nr:chitin synthase export chaperone [Protomyces lactucae-debilis]ORY76086.1 chitin synthase export chaperone [Protomyces lactucae-debilis]
MIVSPLVQLCRAAPLPVCLLLSDDSASSVVGIVPSCYARSALFANTLVLDGPTGILHLLALGITTIMLSNIRQKYAAVGRREFMTVLLLYMMTTFLTLCLDVGVLTPSHAAFPWVVAVQLASGTMTMVCLVASGIVSFCWLEDGTGWLMSVILGAAGLCGGAVFAVTVCTAHSWLNLSPAKSLPLFFLTGPLNALLLVCYAVMQVILLYTKVKNYWPLGNLLFGLIFLVAGQVLLLTASIPLCEATEHYLDGTFIATACHLLAVMMVYKYFDSITLENLEFSIEHKRQVYQPVSMTGPH